MSVQKYPKTVFDAVFLGGKSLSDWIGGAGGLATLNSSSRTEQSPNAIAIDGLLNLTQATTASTMSSIAASLPTGTFKFYCVSDASGGLSSGYISMNSTVGLLFGSSTMGSYVGDLIIIANLSGNKIYHILPLQPRAISVSGEDGVTGTATFDGSSNLNIVTTAGSNIVPKINVLKNNLGSPSVFESGLIDAQYTNKLWFYATSAFLFERSADDITYTQDTTITAANIANLISGNNNGNINIPKGNYLRITITSLSYVFLNMLYMYASTNGGNMSIRIEGLKYGATDFNNIIPTTNTVSNWPGHIVLKHNTIPFANGTSTSQYNQIRIIIASIETSAANTTTNPTETLYGLEWWGGYPSGRRTIYSWDSAKNVAFPAGVTAPAFNGPLSGNASSASKLSAARTIDGISYDGSASINHFGICSTAAAIAAKVVTIAGFSLVTGAVATVKFTYTNSATAPTLNINSTGAKSIFYNGATLSTYVLGVISAGNPIELLYDGSNYHIKNPVTAGAIDAGTISQHHLGDYSVTNTKLDGSLQASIKSVKNSTLVCTGVEYGYSSTDYSGNVYGGTPSEGDLIVGSIDHGVSHTAYAPAILRYNGEVFEVLFYGAECVGKFVFMNDAETGCMLPYYIGGEAIVNMAPLWPFCITNMLLAPESVTGDKIASNTIETGNFSDALYDALNPFYLNQINGPVYLKMSALQMTTPTNAAWGKYATTVDAWNSLKIAAINGIPVYIVDAYPLASNTAKYLCTVMYNSIHGNENNGSFLLQCNLYSTNISGFRFTRISATAFSCESF